MAASMLPAMGRPSPSPRRPELFRHGGLTESGNAELPDQSITALSTHGREDVTRPTGKTSLRADPWPPESRR